MSFQENGEDELSIKKQDIDQQQKIQKEKSQTKNIKNQKKNKKKQKKTLINDDVQIVEFKKKKINYIQPIKQQTSREYNQKLKSIKNPPPAIGHYRPKYIQLDKHSHYTNMYYNAQNQISRKKIEDLGDLEQEKNQIIDKQKNKILGTLQFNQYKNRPEFQSIYEVNERRFELKSQSFHASQILRPPNVIMDKCIGRENYINKNQKNFADYNPQYQLIQNKIIKQIPQFDKQTNRTSFQEKISQDYVNLSNFDHGQFKPREKSQVFQKVRGFSIHKQLSKYESQNNLLPSFMQKNIGNRQSLNQLNQKTLECNNYASSRFQKDMSSFCQFQSNSKKKKKEFDYDLLDYEFGDI